MMQKAKKGTEENISSLIPDIEQNHGSGSYFHDETGTAYTDHLKKVGAAMVKNAEGHVNQNIHSSAPDWKAGGFSHEGVHETKIADLNAALEGTAKDNQSEFPSSTKGNDEDSGSEGEPGAWFDELKAGSKIRKVQKSLEQLSGQVQQGIKDTCDQHWVCLKSDGLRVFSYLSIFFCKD